MGRVLEFKPRAERDVQPETPEQRYDRIRKVTGEDVNALHARFRAAGMDAEYDEVFQQIRTVLGKIIDKLVEKEKSNAPTAG